MTKIESRTVSVDKPAEELYNKMLDFKSFKGMMPESVEHFSAGEDSFEFKMKGMPVIGMKLAETQKPNLIKLNSASSKLDFSLTCHIMEDGENSSQVRYVFLGKLNMMMRMMVEKPLRNFIEKLADQTAKL